ncbi:MAG: sugar phosphate isomerase/epimerase family protein [Candidatus Neomarinimicrobiota bacterium]|nr:sugar phosphate isomerase/epimerase family protein [Candidatus Neomarinimicrobiota bacterium]
MSGISAISLSSCEKTLPFKISLAEWSLHRTIRANKIDHLDFVEIAKNKFDISAIEYVNVFFLDKADDRSYLEEMKLRADDLGVISLLIMCDAEGNLGDPDTKSRTQAIENHYKWVEAAKLLGCHSIRVNARSSGSYEEQIKLAVDGLRQLTNFGVDRNVNIIIENHGGLSSNGTWLAEVIRQVDHPRCGTLPDFGNFQVEQGQWYDRYQGVKELMPYAKAVSAKSNSFDSEGNETHTDYYKMMKIVLDAGYDDYVGIEYEGNELNEMDGIRATKKLLERVGSALS